MVAIPKPKMQTVEAIYRSYEAQERDKNQERFHFGASMSGDECSRRTWYGWRWITKPIHTGRMLRLFDTGNLAEGRFVADLREVGVTVYDFDIRSNPMDSPGQDKQWSVRERSATMGHFGGSLDGIGIGFLEAPKAWHVLEFKTHNDKSFKDLLKDGVEKSKPGHYSQMQVYMHLFSVDYPEFKIDRIDRAFYLAVNKNTDELYQERIKYDSSFGIRAVAKAAQIINNPNPPERISNNPELYICKMCHHRGTCHGTRLPPRHCRSCMHSTPGENGNWHCQKHNVILSRETELKGCVHHRYMPSLVGGAEQVDAADNGEWIDYRTMDGRIWRDRGQRMETL